MMDKEEFEKLRFSIPELIVLECPKCHAELNRCYNCGACFELDMSNDEVSCGKTKHICSDCYEKFNGGEK